jgi:hypothetical protein
MLCCTPSDTPDSDPAQIAADRARAQALRSLNALSRVQTERIIRYESFDLDQGVARPEEALSRQKTIQSPETPPCPCESREKYKRCRGRNAPPVPHHTANSHPLAPLQ